MGLTSPTGPTGSAATTEHAPTTRLRPWMWPALLALASLPPLLGTLLVPEQPVRTGLALSGLVSLLLAVLAGAFLYATRMVSGEIGHEWIAAALVTVGLPGLPFVLATVVSDEAITRYSSGELTEVLGMAAVLAMIWAARREVVPPLRLPPILVGVLVAAAIASLRLLISGWGASTWFDSHPYTMVQRLLVVVMAVLLVVTLGRLAFLPRLVRHLFQVVALGLGVAHVLDIRQFPSTAWHDMASGVLQLTFITLLLATSTHLLRSAVAADRARLEGLSDRAVGAERTAAHGEEVLHELRSALGGISSASELLRRPGDLTDRQRELLESAVQSELGRLGRLTTETHAEARTLRLDELVEPVVAAHRARGLEVTCEVGPRHVHARRDHVAEVLTTLLHNAQRHAPGRRVSVSTGDRPGYIELRVHDDGPGIPPRLRPALFGRGAVGPDSPGTGLGLHVARRLMADLGGDLLLEPDGHPGTTFVALLPTSEELAR